jgi:hypothetical protein
MAVEKIDLLIDGVTYKDIQVRSSQKWSGETEYSIDTAGVAQIMRQYVKNKYGNIKVWARINKFAGGSSVGVNLWSVPNDWYDEVSSFANRFAMYNAPDGYGGDGYWRGSDVGATKTDGTKVGNTSPYMSVYNTPPYNAKERDMPPPDYSKSLPKKSSGASRGKKGFKKFGEKKTEGFELVKSCGNGWNLFVKQDTSDAPYTYRLVKDYEVKPVGKDQFYALKGDMLDTGFSWSVKAQCFEYNRFSEIPQETIKNACGVLSKYFPMTEEFKEEEATPPPTPPTTTTKIPLKSVTLVWDDATFNNLEEVRNYMRTYYYENDESNLPEEGYDKYKIEFVWEDGSKVVDRVDVSSKNYDYNPFKESLGEYLLPNWTSDSDTKWKVYYSTDLKSDISKLSLGDSTETKPKEETEVVNLEQLISDINILVDLETDEAKKMELAGYRNDLQILLSLNN